MKNFLKKLWRVVTFPFRMLWRIVILPFKGMRKLYDFLTTEPEERALGEVLADMVQQPVGLLEHLGALRKHLTRMLVCLVLCVAILFAFTSQMVDLLAMPIGGIESLRAIDVTESVGVFMRVALMGAVVIASPYLAFELWLFAAPGLKPRARIFGLLSIPLVLLFFVGGILFAYFILLPPALEFLLTFMGIQVIPRPSTYINFVTGILFWIGVTFEFPLVIYVLSLMGIVHPQFLLKQWRIAVVIIAVAASAITPTVDPVNMSLVMAPMILLYFLSIGLGYLAILGRKKRELE